ncbi:hypothetical protein AC1031_003967 [Aphanomyces cochlioides]|nr:hypothetical protein AC1031_003967 [Aphanomyces cochlioides]
MVYWTSDGNGSGKSSMDVLLEWLTTPGNYTRWKGGDKSSGETKTALAKQIKLIMATSGIVHRETKDITQKINNMESAYRKAIDWRDQTGQGIEDEGTLMDELNKRCPNFNELDAVMHDRPSTRPLATMDDIDEKSDDSSDDVAQSNEHHPHEKRSKSDMKKVNGSNKRSAYQAKLDDWRDMNMLCQDIKMKEIQQRNDESAERKLLDERRLQLEEIREDRLARESKLNQELLSIKAEQAKMELEVQRQKHELELGVMKFELRMRMKKEGMSDDEINALCQI